MTRDQKVQRWTEREARRSLHTMIIDDEKGGYVAFGRYLSADINYNKQMAHKGKNHEFQELVITKLESKVGHYSLVDRELEKCLNLAKYIQLKGFQNETARTSGR